MTAAVIAAAALVPLAGASAYTLTTLHAFCSWANCGDGIKPGGPLLMDQSGNLYGTTKEGGKNGDSPQDGVVFKLVPNADRTAYSEKILHNFCARTNCADGTYPDADLIMDVDGNLYGVTGEGGQYGAGAVFKLTHGTNGWSLSIVHSFCGDSTCADGSFPLTGLAYAGKASGAPWDKHSPLFGATFEGGTHDDGAVYELKPTTEFGVLYYVIHSFDSSGGPVLPGPLLVDPSGNVFGTTRNGSKYGHGLLYRLAASSWNETVLHYFCAQPNCADGRDASGVLAMDAAGTLFGTTETGGTGAHCKDSDGCGVAFERPRGGPYQVIYNFCARRHCKDGYEPVSGLIWDASGNLLGTTFLGGPGGWGGTAFKLSPGATWTETVLQGFGNTEPSSLTLDGTGDLFGTTSNGAGSVFELTP